MVDRRLRKEARAVGDGAALGIVGAVIEARDAGVGDRAGAHRAGLQRHIEVAAVETFVPQPGRGSANRDDFGMRGRIVRFPGAVGADRKSVVEGKSVAVRVDLGGRRIIKKKMNCSRSWKK